jgi:5'-phosphate synthase pdxT subunit
VVTGAVRVGVLALQGDVREHLRMLAELGGRGVAVRRPEELAGVDGLIMPGGESTAIARLAQRFDLLDPLRAAIRAGLPVYGSCAGMILLAERVLDGEADQVTVGGLDVTVRRNAFGRQIDSFEDDVTLSALDGEPVRAVFIRAPWVEQAGPQVEVLGRLAGKVVAVRQAGMLATSFHPELTGDSRVHGLFVRMVEEATR